jgi:hypothetical protein
MRNFRAVISASAIIGLLSMAFYMGQTPMLSRIIEKRPGTQSSTRIPLCAWGISIPVDYDRPEVYNSIVRRKKETKEKKDDKQSDIYDPGRLPDHEMPSRAVPWIRRPD